MSHRLRVSIAMVVVAALGAACGSSDGPTARASQLPADDPLALSVQHRLARTPERLPDVMVVGAAGALQFRVARQALCATLASGRAGVNDREVTIVATVSPNPAALCTPRLDGLVVEYSGVVGLLAPGPYTVYVWERYPEQRARLLRTTTVWVL